MIPLDIYILLDVIGFNEVCGIRPGWVQQKNCQLLNNVCQRLLLKRGGYSDTKKTSTCRQKGSDECLAALW